MAIIVDTSSQNIVQLNLLTLVQNFYRRTNIGTVPTSVIGSSDSQVSQILSLLEEEGNDLSGRGDWESLTFETTHTTTATENQGSISEIADNNIRYFKHNTFWDRTENLPLSVIDGPDWQAEKGFASTSPRYRVRVRSGNLIATPTPPAGNTWAFEYVSWNWILDNDNVTYKQYFTEDADTFLLPTSILLMGLRWRWKKEKGFDYSEDFMTYEKMVHDAIGRQGIPKTLRMDQAEKESVPGIVVSQGSWNL